MVSLSITNNGAICGPRNQPKSLSDSATWWLNVVPHIDVLQVAEFLSESIQTLQLVVTQMQCCEILQFLKTLKFADLIASLREWHVYHLGMNGRCRSKIIPGDWPKWLSLSISNFFLKNSTLSITLCVLYSITFLVNHLNIQTSWHQSLDLRPLFLTTHTVKRLKDEIFLAEWLHILF